MLTEKFDTVQFLLSGPSGPGETGTGHGIQFLPQYSFMPQTKKLRISQKHWMRAIFMQNWQLEVIFDSWLKNRYIIWQAWNYISMQLWFRPVLIGIDRFCSLRELQTNDCECWYARWVLHRDYKYMQNTSILHTRYLSVQICTSTSAPRVVPLQPTAVQVW